MTGKATILVVDDNEVDRTFLEKTLQRGGYTVVTAINGKGGLEAVEGQKPDLILLDCDMPVMDGLEMCRRIKENNETMNIPVIFLTGLDTPELTVDCFEADAENYLSKPISGRVLLNQINVVLKNPHAHQS